jgi:RNA polymerase sigma-70 factor (ECF subfamily)
VEGPHARRGGIERRGANDPGRFVAEVERGDQDAVVAADRALIASIRGADEAAALEAFEVLYRRHADLLIAFTASVLEEPADAVDVVHDVFVTLWEHRTTWHPDATRGVRGYLYASVRNAARNRARTERRAAVRALRVVESAEAQVVEPQVAEPVSVENDADELLAQVWAALGRFPTLRKQVALLRWGEGMSPQGIAETLDISRNAVDQHLYRAIHALRALLPSRLT